MDVSNRSYTHSSYAGYFGMATHHVYATRGVR